MNKYSTIGGRFTETIAFSLTGSSHGYLQNKATSSARMVVVVVVVMVVVVVVLFLMIMMIKMVMMIMMRMMVMMIVNYIFVLITKFDCEEVDDGVADDPEVRGENDGLPASPVRDRAPEEDGEHGRQNAAQVDHHQHHGGLGLGLHLQTKGRTGSVIGARNEASAASLTHGHVMRRFHAHQPMGQKRKNPE